MKDNEYGLAIVRAKLREIVLGKVGCSWRKGFVMIVMLRHCKVYSEGAAICLVVGVKYLSAVVDGRALFLHCSPHGLDVTIEE